MKKETILLILGALTSLFLVKFNLLNGIEFLGYKTQTSFIDYAGESSTDNFLTTQLISYIIFFIFGFSIKESFMDNKRIAITAFMIILTIGVFNESLAIYENLIGEFNGRHCRVGNLLTFIGLLFLLKIKRFQNK